jgi:polyhydroxyalkanoate synthesis regulator phasin
VSDENKAKESEMERVEKVASAVLGLLALSEERAKQLFDTLVDKGTKAKAERSSRISRILAQAEAEKQAIVQRAREEFSKALSRLNLATKDDIARLEKLINEKLK